MKKRLHLIVHGRVQDVSYRYYTARNARGLQLTGFVRNLADGTVEVVVEGEEENRKKLLEYSKEGPMVAKVTRVDHEWEEPKDEFTEFNVEYFF